MACTSSQKAKFVLHDSMMQIENQAIYLSMEFL